MDDVPADREIRTTINVSRAFADIVTDLAGDSDETVRAYCDRFVTAMLRPHHLEFLRRKIAQHHEIGSPVG